MRKSHSRVNGGVQPPVAREAMSFAGIEFAVARVPLPGKQAPVRGARIDASALFREMARRGLRSDQLARLAGVSAATISHALNGHPISVASLSRVAGALSRVPVIEGVDDLLVERAA